MTVEGTPANAPLFTIQNQKLALLINLESGSVEVILLAGRFVCDNFELGLHDFASSTVG